MLAAAVLEVDGVTTLGWLSRLVPHNPKAKLTRETCQVIAGVFFFGSKPLRFLRIGDEGNQSEALVGVLKALITSCC